jgi:hypothetical protein
MFLSSHSEKNPGLRIQRQVAFGNSTGMPVVLLSTLAPSLVAEGLAICLYWHWHISNN